MRLSWELQLCLLSFKRAISKRVYSPLAKSWLWLWPIYPSHHMCVVFRALNVLLWGPTQKKITIRRLDFIVKSWMWNGRSFCSGNMHLHTCTVVSPGTRDIVERSPGVTNQGDSFNPLISPASAANTGTSNLENWTQKGLDLFICCSQLTNQST